MEPDLRAAGGNVAAAEKVGELLAERAKSAGIETVVFDRGGFMYHGRVAALAEALAKGRTGVLMASDVNQGSASTPTA